MPGRQLDHARKQREWRDAKQAKSKAAKLLQQAQKKFDEAQADENKKRREMFGVTKKNPT